MHYTKLYDVHRHGKQGVAMVNSWVEEVLERAGLLKTGGLWYEGRPVMISRNASRRRRRNRMGSTAMPDRAVIV